jgi:hypothetical protein
MHGMERSEENKPYVFGAYLAAVGITSAGLSLELSRGLGILSRFAIAFLVTLMASVLFVIIYRHRTSRDENRPS